MDYLIPDRTKSIRQGGIIYYKNIVGTENLEWQRFKALIDYYKIDIDKPIKDLKKSELDILLYGSKDLISYRLASRSGNVMKKTEFIEGVCTLIERRYMETSSTMSREWYATFLAEAPCPICKGRRLNEQALSVRVGGINIYEWTTMSVK